MEIETPETVAARIRRALEYVEPERLILAPDCGMKYLPREVAFGKLCALVEGARIVRRNCKPRSRAYKAPIHCWDKFSNVAPHVAIDSIVPITLDILKK